MKISFVVVVVVCVVAAVWHLGILRATAHGQAVRESANTARSEADPTADYVNLFNGKDLSGWRPVGNASWKVRDGLLVGRQGPGGAPGDLLTDEEFDDFELVVTFRMEWPANSGVWYRYQSPEKAYQADILEYKDPVAYSGTLYSPGKMFLAVNEDPSLVHRDGWNELVIRAAGDHHEIMLNGTRVADVRDDSYRRGRVGFQIHAGAEFEKMQIFIKEVRLLRL